LKDVLIVRELPEYGTTDFMGVFSRRNSGDVLCPALVDMAASNAGFDTAISMICGGTRGRLMPVAAGRVCDGDR